MASEARVGMATKIVSVLLALMFVMMGVTKLTGTLMVEEFARWGYDPWFRIVIGVVELLAGVAVLKASTRFYAAVTIIVVMLGAIVTLGRAGEMAPPPIVMLLLAAFVAFKARGQSEAPTEA